MKLTWIPKAGLLAFVPLTKGRGLTVYPLAWTHWADRDNVYNMYVVRRRDWALFDYIDHHPASPWHLLPERANA